MNLTSRSEQKFPNWHRKDRKEQSHVTYVDLQGGCPLYDYNYKNVQMSPKDGTFAENATNSYSFPSNSKDTTKKNFWKAVNAIVC